MRILARQQELKILEKIYLSKNPEFLAIYGRRRVGKTFLIRQFFRDKGFYFEVTGIRKGSLKQQLQAFSIEFARVFANREINNPPCDWMEAFAALRKALEGISKHERVILFFDELPWIASPRSGFLQAIDHFWNRYFSDDRRVILIVCGSAASWMIKKVIRNKGGLHGRLTAQMRLLPFNLAETESFLLHRDIKLDRKQLIDIYMAIGGVAKYLTLIEKGQSSLQTVSELCFNGPLFNEFNELYASLFEHHNRHVSVVKALAQRACGLTLAEISENSKISSGGGLSDILTELEESGFIIPIGHFGKKKKNAVYKLVDEYSLFYLKWIAQAKSMDLTRVDDQYWLKMASSPSGRAWSGYAFESLCMKHVNKIKEALGIRGVTTSECGWIYKPEKNSGERGVQIDLLIDRADHCINLCEIKYAAEPFVINKSYTAELLAKKAAFVRHTHTKKSVFLTLITTYGVNKKAGDFGVVDVELTMNDLF